MPRIAVAMSPRERWGELRLVDLTVGKRDVGLLPKAREALSSYAQADPVGFGRLTRDLRHVAVAHLGGASGEFWPELRACVLDANHVRNDHKESVILTIAHEAVHARLHRLGFRWDGPQQERLERACVRAEISLAERRGITGAVLDEARRALERRSRAPEDVDQRIGAQLRQLGWPRWAIRLRSALFRRG